MLTELRLLLQGILAPTLYAGVFVIFAMAVVKHAERALWLLVILAPLPVIWYRLHPLPLGSSTMDILLLGAFLGILVNKGGFERAPSMGVIGTFMLVSYFALWNATLRFNLPIPFTTENPLLPDWKNYFEMIFLYFLAYNALKDEDRQKTMVVIMAAVVLFIMVRETRNFTEGEAFSYDKRAEGPFWIVGLGANHFGAFIAHYSGLLLGLSLIDRHKYRKWLYLAAVMFSIFPLFFSYSRGAYVAVLALVTVYGLIKKRTLLVLVAVLVITWQTVLPPTVVERISMTEDSSGEIEASAGHRLIMWQHAEQLFKDNAVFGIGFNAFGYTVPQGELLTDTHNFYLKTAAEQGLIGLVIMALILLRAFLSGWSLYRQGRSDFHRGLGLGFFGCTLAVAVTNIFGDRWSYFALGSYFWVFWGLVDRARSLAQEPEAPRAVSEPATLPSSVAAR